jgi:hypothetical protein
MGEGSPPGSFGRRLGTAAAASTRHCSWLGGPAVAAAGLCRMATLDAEASPTSPLMNVSAASTSSFPPCMNNKNSVELV